MNEPTELYSSMITYDQRSKPNMTQAAIYGMVSHLQSSGCSSQLFHPSPETIQCGGCDGGIVAIMLRVSPDKMHRTAHVMVVRLTYPHNCVCKTPHYVVNQRHCLSHPYRAPCLRHLDSVAMYPVEKTRNGPKRYEVSTFCSTADPILRCDSLPPEDSAHSDDP
jgi:hypothetical protein